MFEVVIFSCTSYYFRYCFRLSSCYFGAPQKMATDKQPFLAILSTLQENRYPQYLKLYAIPKYAKNTMEKFLEKSIVTGSERTLNTDAKSTFSLVEEKINLKSDNWYLSWNI